MSQNQTLSLTYHSGCWVQYLHLFQNGGTIICNGHIAFSILNLESLFFKTLMQYSTSSTEFTITYKLVYICILLNSKFLSLVKQYKNIQINSTLQRNLLCPGCSIAFKCVYNTHIWAQCWDQGCQILCILRWQHSLGPSLWPLLRACTVV